MAWDTERTKAALLAAAVAEFCEHGFAGTRIDAVSRRAGVNRERLYSYFGSKRGLFEAVLADRLGTILDGVPVSGAGPDAVADFAGGYFDACAAHPELPRLVFWEGLELVHPIDLETRSERAAQKAGEIRAAMPELSAAAAAELLLTIVTLCHAWFASPNLGIVITADDGDHARRRAEIVITARSVSAAVAAR